MADISVNNMYININEFKFIVDGFTAWYSTLITIVGVVAVVVVINTYRKDIKND